MAKPSSWLPLRPAHAAKAAALPSGAGGAEGERTAGQVDESAPAAGEGPAGFERGDLGEVFVEMAFEA